VTLAIELEDGTPLYHEVQLLVPVRLLLRLVRLLMLGDHPVAGVPGGPGVDAEACDAEVMSHGTHRAVAVVLLGNVVDVHHRYPLMGTPFDSLLVRKTQARPVPFSPCVCTSLRLALLRMALVVARETVARELIPGRSRSDERVELRPDTRLAVERAEADRYFFALRPLRAEQARAADRTEGLHTSIVRPEDADQLFAGKQAEPVARDASLASTEGA
jgi:hypothetical protein